MKINIVAPLILASTLTACGDGVPEISDPQHIVINGKNMSKMEFINEYCNDKVINETCTKVRRAELQESTKGKIPRF